MRDRMTDAHVHNSVALRKERGGTAARTSRLFCDETSGTPSSESLLMQARSWAVAGRL